MPITLSYPQLVLGQRIRFCGSSQPFTIQQVSPDGRFAIGTRPFNLKRTVHYTVIDFAEGVRGADNHYGVGYETQDEIDSAMDCLVRGKIAVSYRNWVYLRYASTQPDPRTADGLNALREHSIEVFRAREFQRQNGATRTLPTFDDDGTS
jgi:hypothetical protein